MLTAGTIIKKEREIQNLSLEEITSATKIQKHYLEALEADDYDKFPSTVYAKGFLRNYSRYLGVDTEKVTALFRRSVENEATAQVKDSKRPIQKIRFSVTPSTIIIGSVLLLILFTFGYLFYQFYNFQKPPRLEISSPENNITVDTSEIVVEGITENNMFITINDEPIRINEDGSFKVDITLSKGQNTLVIKAKHPDDIGKEAVVSRQVEFQPTIVEKPEAIAGEETKEEQTLTMNITIEIKKESTWLEVTSDNIPFKKLVVPGTTLTYEADNTVTISTGKIASTLLKINEVEKGFYITASGSGIIECKIENNKINCQQP
ncbi:MAG: helix-turn-helix domain-containing protein [bacterium]